MTLKNSFSDLLRENLKRRLWSAALSLLLFFFLYPVAALLSASGAFSPERAGTFSEDMTQEMILFMTRRSLHTSWISWVSAENPLFCFLLPVTAMILSFPAAASADRLLPQPAAEPHPALPGSEP